jgi:hypothetical protein
MIAIPTEIHSKINPDIEDPISKSVIYSFTAKDTSYDNQNNILYKFPYSKDTYWTNFKYSCYNIITNQPVQLEIGIELVTTDGFVYCVQMLHKREDKKWYETEWPVPSVKTDGFNAGIYFKINLPEDRENYSLNISLLGFMDLFPSVNNYILLSTLDTYQFVFNKNEVDENENRGTIWNIENYPYIQDCIGTACGIRMIKRY